MRPNSGLITRLLYNFGSFFSIALALALIIWSYVERGFYKNYVAGEPYLVWTVYILPWVVIIANVIWQWRR
jgi:hypothetical protein